MFTKLEGFRYSESATITKVPIQIMFTKLEGFRYNESATTTNVSIQIQIMFTKIRRLYVQCVYS